MPGAVSDSYLCAFNPAMAVYAKVDKGFSISESHAESIWNLFVDGGCRIYLVSFVNLIWFTVHGDPHSSLSHWHTPIAG